MLRYFHVPLHKGPIATALLFFDSFLLSSDSNRHFANCQRIFFASDLIEATVGAIAIRLC